MLYSWEVIKGMDGDKSGVVGSGDSNDPICHVMELDFLEGNRELLQAEVEVTELQLGKSRADSRKAHWGKTEVDIIKRQDMT